MVVEFSHDKDGHLRTEMLELDIGVVAGDDAGLFQPAQPFPARRGAEIDPFGQFGFGYPAFPRQGGEDLNVTVIEFDWSHAHDF